MKDIKTLICSDKKKTATILGAGTAAVLYEYWRINIPLYKG